MQTIEKGELNNKTKIFFDAQTAICLFLNILW